jgi:YihY family inner membrane protein
MANPVERLVRPLDRRQQRNPVAARAYAVIKKFGDDRGGMLAGMVTFYGFLSLFPLMLVGFTILGFVAGGPNSHLYGQIQRSALSEFPVIGDQLKTNNGLYGSGFGLAVGLVALLWGSLGVTQAIQFAVNEAWGVPNRDRPSFLARALRGLGTLGLFGLGLVGTTALTSAGAIVGDSQLAGALGVAAALALNVSLFLGIFWLLSPKGLRLRDLLPGAALAGVGWQALQVVGQSLVRHNLKHTSVVYGQFAVVLGLISFLSLAAQLVMYAVELNVVLHERLWPRSIVQAPLLEADRRALAMRATQEERSVEQRVHVSWGDAPPAAVEPPQWRGWDSVEPPHQVAPARLAIVAAIAAASLVAALLERRSAR